MRTLVIGDIHGGLIALEPKEKAGENTWFEPVGREIFKDPITDDGIKKSAKGLLSVKQDSSGYNLVDQVSWEEEQSSLLQTIFKDGKFYNETTLTEIRERLKDNK